MIFIWVLTALIFLSNLVALVVIFVEIGDFIQTDITKYSRTYMQTVSAVSSAYLLPSVKYIHQK